jgi:zinc transport system ATP-binding protein
MPISVEYFLRLFQEIDDKYLQEIISKINISKLLSKKIDVLSGGEMQRVLLAKALLNQPDLLILDEPAQNLDITGQLKFYELLNEIYKSQEVAILMVSHDLHMVMSSTKQVICLFHHICCLGTPEDITKNPEFISIFGNDMSKLISIYNHYHNHKHG